MGVARRVAATILLLLSLWQLVAWGFWGLLVLLFAQGLYGNSEVSSTGRQVVLGLLLLALAALNPVAAAGLLWRGSVFAWALVVGVFVADGVAFAFLFSASTPIVSMVVGAIAAAGLLAVAFPRHAKQRQAGVQE